MLLVLYKVTYIDQRDNVQRSKELPTGIGMWVVNTSPMLSGTHSIITGGGGGVTLPLWMSRYSYNTYTNP